MSKFMPKLIHSSSGQPQTALWLVLMFLFAFNFMSAGGYLLLGLMALYTVLHLREFSFRAAEVFLFVFGVEYFLFYFLWYQGASLGDVCNYLVAPWLIYWMGRNMACRSSADNLPLRAATALTLGFWAYGLLCIIYSMYVAPPMAGSRLMYKFWDQTPLSVTSGGLLFPMAIGISMGQLTARNKLRTRLFWLAVLGVCVYYCFTWAHRTTIYIIGILAVYNYLAFLFAMEVSPVRKTFLVLGSVLLASVVTLCLVLDVGGCHTWLQGQWLYQRLTDPLAANSGSRFEIWSSFFSQWLLYPLGGKQFDISASFVHNMWLDVYYLCGVLPFLALLAATVRITANVLRYRKVRAGDSRSAHILANCFISVFLAFMVEPVMSAYPYVLLAMLLISGCIDGAIMKAQQTES